MAPGNFHVVILGPDGSPRLQAAVGRHESRQMHHLPEPLADGMVLDAMQRLLIVRISNEGRAGEVWWIYDLATGKELSRWEPAANDASLRFVIAARPIAGTPLILLNWWQYDAEESEEPRGGVRTCGLNRSSTPPAGLAGNASWGLLCRQHAR